MAKGIEERLEDLEYQNRGLLQRIEKLEEVNALALKALEHDESERYWNS
jgi:hypothetical protein